MMVHPSSTRISRVPAYLFVCLVPDKCFVYGTVTLFRRPSQNVLLALYLKSHQALPLSLAATQRISFDFFSFGYLDVSVPRVRFPTLCIQVKMTILAYRRVPPFGHLWINARFQLPKAFRRIPRPSSPLTA